MSQWGKVINIGGVILCPHLLTNCFESAEEGSIIEDIHLMEYAGDIERAGLIHSMFKEKYIGKRYGEWLSALSTIHNPLIGKDEFDKWYESEGIEMQNGGCSPKIIASAAWFVATNETLKSLLKNNDLKET